MLVDRFRTESFLKAILATVRPGDVVVEIGSGTGVLALFAVLAGAARVYAIERGPIIDLAREVAERNGASDRITFIPGASPEAELPERADVLVTETIGNLGLDEGIVAWVRDAQVRLLRPDARLVPRCLMIEVCLADVPRDHADLSRWSRPLMALDFAPLHRVAMNNLVWTDLNPAALLSEPATMFTVDLADPPKELEGTIRLQARRAGTAHGIGVWFRAMLAPGIEISNRPPNEVPSWEQGLLPFCEPVDVVAGETVEISVAISGGGGDWMWQAGHGRRQSTDIGRLARDDERGR